MKFTGITKRWAINVASIVLVILLIVSLFAFALVRNYYYGTAELFIENYDTNDISSVFSLYGASDTGFEDAARGYVENFSNKDHVAVWVIDSSGKVIATSSGFSISENVNMPDFNSAVKNETGTDRWTGKLPSGEKIMASTNVYRYSDGSLGGGIRFMVSLDAVDQQLARIALLIFFTAVLMFAVLMISGMVFIKSIVNPVKEIGETAGKIAGGDFNARIEDYPYNDEIGELCVTINDMAGKLSETDRMKNDFISTVSHELRTPLTAIRGWGETLIQIGDSDPGMTKRGMEIIISEAGRLNSMVEELLDFSRMNSGRLKYKSEKMDFLAELDDVVYSFKERTMKNGIEIVYNFPDFPAPGTGDPARIKQVFINILDNAVKYSDEGGKITVSAEIIDKKSLVITFADTGAGIKEEDLPHIKEKFYKANNTVRGSGIGLAVCDEILSHHGGELAVDSVYGEGTTVTVTLPLDKASKQADNTEPKEENDNE
ncbi:MAG: HAMP domain-containing histidine kinase [Clostridia bacterium]|nr:HAMP domain-containing histidine kinase [Clostridia bacterium]